jgi:hypothetical protein
LRVEQALQVVGPRSVTSHIRRQALESAAESLEPTFALEFLKYEERPRGSVVALALRPRLGLRAGQPCGVSRY